MDNPLEFLEQQSAPGEEDQSQTPGQSTPDAAPAGEPAVQTPPRGPDGKFIAKEPDPEPPAPTPPPPEPGHVPISAMLDEREKRQAAERARQVLEERLAAMERARTETPPLLPEQQLQAALYAQNLKVSRRFAERQYGAEEVQALHEWAVARCDADPIFNQQMRSTDDPYEAAMQARNRERILETVKPEQLDAFLAWQAAQAAAANPGAPAPDSHQSQPVPPRSLATAPGSGTLGRNQVPIGESAAYDALPLG